MKTNRELRNAAIFVLVSTYTTIALPVGRLARVMTPVSPLKHRDICAFFTDDQMKKIQHRKRYIKKQKAETSTKDHELDLLGEDDGDSFTGSNADLESAADNLFTSPPCPQLLAFSSLSLKTPAKSVPPTPGTALQQKIETNLEKSLGNS